MAMYGSTHTHFESRYDTGNDLQDMVAHFLANGARKVAVTEHGVFSSYEDLRDIVRDLRGKAKSIKAFAEENNISLASPASELGQDAQNAVLTFNWHNDKISDSEKEMLSSLSPQEVAFIYQLASEFDVIPGIEGYFGENQAHLILIAKDYEGYLSLCKIISQSNEWLRDHGGSKPIITKENLEENVRKGHLFCTSACIGGPFGHLLGLDAANLDAKIDKYQSFLETSGYQALSETINAYEKAVADSKACKVTKKERTQAEKEAKLGETSRLEDIARREAEGQRLSAYLETEKESYEEAVQKIKEIGKASITRTLNALAKAQEDREKLESSADREKAKQLLTFFQNTFGEDSFFLELQNHEIPVEKTVYQNLIRFGLENGCTNFLASNDIHVGTRKGDQDFEDQLTRRNVIQFTRFKQYRPEGADAREYVIKSDEDLREELEKLFDPEFVESLPGKEAQAKEILDTAFQNIKGLLGQCDVRFVKEDHYPKFCEDENAEFERNVREGIAVKFPSGFPDERYQKALERELQTIKKMGYAGYHLIVADYLNYGRLLGYLPSPEEVENAPLSVEKLDAYIAQKGYPRVGYNIGPGRGSAVGSLCCYLLGITDIDPIPYNLFFERFLNEERVSMPDIDSDFRTDIREKVIDYCRAKYGKECICQIMTKQYGATKGNLRLAARYLASQSVYEKYAAQDVLDMDAQAEDESGEEVLGDTERKKRNKELEDTQRIWAKKADELSKQCDKDGNLPDAPLSGDYQKIAELALTLDGVFTNYGQHAAGTIISSTDVTNVIPIMWNDKKGSMETQCTMAQAEEKGLLKMDFLGLNNLDIITDILRHPSAACIKEFIQKAPEIYRQNMKKGVLDTTLNDYSRRDAMLKDPEIFQKIFCTGYTQGVFQFESDGMKNMLKDFQPESFEDIILLVAAYRPGPMDYIPEIVAQKWYEKRGKKGTEPKHSITIKNEALDKILAPTYHCPIYQEQIMQIFQQMAGYSLGGADLVRRAMSKKKMDVLKKEKDAFIYGDPERGIAGCMKQQGLTEKEADDLFEQMMPFAKYGFNKSHATAYAMVSMFTAYLKLYHTADFYRASLNEIKELAEIPAFVKDMQSFGLRMLPPSMESADDFTVSEDGKAILFGLRHIKGFGSQDEIRRADTVQEFIERNLNVSSKVLQTYARLGIFKGAWEKDLRKRPGVSRHEILRMIDRDAETLQSYYASMEKISVLQEQKALLDPQDTEKHLAMDKDIQKETDKKKQLAGVLNQHFAEDMAEKVKKESNLEVLENRRWEVEMLSVPFDYSESLAKIQKSSNHTTFRDLQTAYGRYGRESIPVPCVVLSVSDVKYTKTSKAPYYEATLMDREQNIITRRFDKVPTLLEGEFPLMVEENKFWLCSADQGTVIAEAGDSHRNQKNNGYVMAKEMTTTEKAAALSRGAMMNRIQIGGNRSVAVVEKKETLPENDSIEEIDQER